MCWYCCWGVGVTWIVRSLSVFCEAFYKCTFSFSSGADPGEVKRVNFHPPFSESPSFFFYLIPQILIGSNTLLQKFTPHFKFLDPRLLLCIVSYIVCIRFVDLQVKFTSERSTTSIPFLDVKILLENGKI